MKLYFLRHAEAEEGLDDGQRALTAKGRRDARRMGRYLSELNVVFDLAFTSPLVRAVETAKLVLRECPLRRRAPQLARVDTLLHDATGTAFKRWLNLLPDAESILLVGHEPSLSGHIRTLMRVPVEEALSMAKGAVARVDWARRKPGVLRLLIAPKHLP
jgi:phosphohistidine phosphatase